MLLADEAIDEALVAKLLSWQHSGFFVDNQVRIDVSDAEGRQQIARYMVCAPFSLDKAEYKAEQGVIVYRSKRHATLKRQPQIIPSAKGLSPVAGLPSIRCPLSAFLSRHIKISGKNKVIYRSLLRYGATLTIE